MHRRLVSIALLVLFLFVIVFAPACEPLVTQFDDVEAIEITRADQLTPSPQSADSIKIMTWNIRFGIGRIPWFGDSCGDRVIASESEVTSALRAIVARINDIKPDILILQEVDVKSKRSAYIDQLRWILNNTHLNYAAFAPTWKSQFVPSDGLGRIETGNATLSRWNILSAERIQLPLRGDQDALTRYFYLRYAVLKTRIDIPHSPNFHLLNVHLTAFATDDTKRRQVDVLHGEISRLATAGYPLIVGGDFNLLPPTSDSTDFCFEDICPGESFHGPGDNPRHKEGSNYTPEIGWMQVFYDTLKPEIPLERYALNQRRYFTHHTRPDVFWDRKLDYLFTNREWIPNSDSTYQNGISLSDHAAVSAYWRVAR